MSWLLGDAPSAIIAGVGLWRFESCSTCMFACSTLSLGLKVDKILPLKTTCPMCGGNCTIDIAAIKQKVSFAMPDCPIAKGAGASAARALQDR